MPRRMACIVVDERDARKRIVQLLTDAPLANRLASGGSAIVVINQRSSPPVSIKQIGARVETVIPEWVT
jgi:hypothetical protein